MSARKLKNINLGQSPYSDEVESSNILKIGLMALEIGNNDNLLEPYIKAGGALEINNVVYVFKGDESITGDLTGHVGKVYIRTHREVIDGAEVLTLVYDTGTLPEWNRMKKGYYDGNDKYLASFSYVDGIYQNKKILSEDTTNPLKSIQININQVFYRPVTIAYSNYYHCFYLGHITSTSATIIRSFDLVDFEIVCEVSLPDATSFNMSDFTFSENGIHFAVGFKNASSPLQVRGETKHFVSLDGETFTQCNGIPSPAFGATYHPFCKIGDKHVLSVNVFTADFTSYYATYYTDDVTGTWTKVNDYLGGIYTAGETFLLNTALVIYSSMDGVTWADTTPSRTGSTYAMLLYQISEDVVAMTCRTEFFETTDGITWDLIATDSTFANNTSSYVAFGSDRYFVLGTDLYRIEPGNSIPILILSGEDGTYYSNVFSNYHYIVTYDSTVDLVLGSSNGSNWVSLFPVLVTAQPDVSIGLDKILFLSNLGLFSLEI